MMDVAAAIAEPRSRPARSASSATAGAAPVAWLAARAPAGLACSVPYYGGGMPNFIDEKPKMPGDVPFRRAGPVARRSSRRRRSPATHPEITAHFYAGAGHGFNCDHRGSYNAAAAKLARERTLAFFRPAVG